MLVQKQVFIPTVLHPGSLGYQGQPIGMGGVSGGRYALTPPTPPRSATITPPPPPLWGQRQQQQHKKSRA